MIRTDSFRERVSSLCCFSDLSYDQYRLLIALSIILGVASLLVQARCIGQCTRDSYQHTVKLTLCSCEAGILFVLICLFSMLLWKPRKRLCILSSFFCIFVAIISATEFITRYEVLEHDTQYDYVWDTLEVAIAVLHLLPAIICYRFWQLLMYNSDDAAGSSMRQRLTNSDFASQSFSVSVGTNETDGSDSENLADVLFGKDPFRLSNSGSNSYSQSLKYENIKVIDVDIKTSKRDIKEYSGLLENEEKSSFR